MLIILIQILLAVLGLSITGTFFALDLGWWQTRCALVWREYGAWGHRS